MTFNYSRIIPKPLRDFVKRYTGRRTETCECPAHGVRRYPMKSYRGTVTLERSGEVITITVYSLRNFRSKHVWLSWAIPVKKFAKLFCKGDASFFPVFAHEGSSVSDVDRFPLSHLSNPTSDNSL